METKKMLKNLGIVLGVVVLLVVVLIIFAAVKNSKVNNKQLLNTMESAAKKYYAKHKELLNEKGASVSIDTLVAEGYLKPFNKLTKNTNCTGNVTVSYNGSDYTYLPYVKCNEYTSLTIADKLKTTVVTSGDGLYKDGNIYYYKGEYVNNYIKLGDTLYRIISIDSKGNVKVIATTPSKESYVWDDRYNAEKNQSSLGINDYEKSRMKESLTDLYNRLSANVKKYVLTYDWCIDKLSTDNLTFGTCSKTVSDNLGLVDAREFALASMDSNCHNLYDVSCQNYNYFVKLFGRTVWTMNAVNDNTYEAVSISEDGAYTRRVSSASRIYVTFYVSGLNTYTSGEGTEKNPYVVR